MGETNICSWRIIPALSFLNHVTVEFNVGWENLNTARKEMRQRTAAKETIFCYTKANWVQFNAKFDQARRDSVDSPRKHRVKKESLPGTKDRDLSQDRGRTPLSWRIEECRQLSR